MRNSSFAVIALAVFVIVVFTACGSEKLGLSEDAGKAPVSSTVSNENLEETPNLSDPQIDEEQGEQQLTDTEQGEKAKERVDVDQKDAVIGTGKPTQPKTVTPVKPKTPPAPAGDSNKKAKPGQNTGSNRNDAKQVTAHPESITVLVNKQIALPDNYKPTDLVFPNVAFTFKEKIDKRKMRKVASQALEKMFARAKKDGIYLAGVSAYRSHATQKALFNRYVKKDGLAKARTYSAEPGHSEHETGLAVDVSGSNGKCAAEDCFAGTKEANWLAKHAAEYGFIVRYPKGKQSITGYQYEPWHLRYVGVKLAQTVTGKGITLEEYYNAVPVTK